MKRVGFRRTIQLVRSDYAALLRFFRKTENSWATFVSFMLFPGFVAVLLYRLAHFRYTNGRKLSARLIHWLGLILTGAEINPACQVDEGFVILHPTGMVVSAKIGKNVVLTAGVGLGGDGSWDDIGAGPGLPVIGDRVIMGGRSTVLGPRKVGDDAFVCGGTFVINDVPPGATVFGTPARRVMDTARKQFKVMQAS
jgi:serine O-acetyltransferase